VVGAGGGNPAYIATAVENGSLTEGILLTLGTMLLFILATRALSSESAEVRALRAELAKYRKVLK
jgi:hypothetical protein